MRVYNYTSLKQRDTKIYNIGGYNIGGGVSVTFLSVVGPVAIVIILLFALIGIPFGISFFNPFSEHFIFKYTFAGTTLGIGIGCLMWYLPVSGYRLYEYLIAYFKPKGVYINDFRHTKRKFTNIKIKTFIKNIL